MIVSSTPSITGLSAGTYIATVSADNACTASDTIALAGSVALTHTVKTTNTSCGMSNGAITIDESGGTPAYKYTWQPNVSATAFVSNISEYLHYYYYRQCRMQGYRYQYHKPNIESTYTLS